MNIATPDCYILLQDAVPAESEEHFLSVQSQLQHRVATLLRHENGASVEELTLITKAELTQVHRCIRMIINAGGAVTLQHDSERECVFYLLD